MYYIYCIRNTKNNKVYIGQTNNPKRRKNSHRTTSYNDHFRSAKKKYGLSVFVFEVIETTSVDDVDVREQFWISKYDSMNPARGYNKQSGGNLHKHLSEETKRKIGNSHRGKTLTPTQIATRTGARLANGNLYHSTEERMVISKNTKGKPKSPRSKQHRDKIRQNQLGKQMSADSIAKRTATRRRNNNGEY